MTATIGLFDSGVGGLSVWRELARALPKTRALYIADHAHVPYGPRPAHEVRAFARAIVAFLEQRGARLIVVASNTTSAAALELLRRDFPKLLFVGVEPPVKPAAERTRSGVVGVLATELTAASDRLAGLVSRFGKDVRIITIPCPGLVDAVEAGDLESPATSRLLRKLLAPLIAAGVDQVVLGCTHYPFLRPALARILGPGVDIIDPAPAVARQVVRLLAQAEITPDHGDPCFFTTKEPARLSALLGKLLPLTSAHIEGLVWRGDELKLET